MSVSLFYCPEIPCYHLSSTSKHEGEMKPRRGRSRLYILTKGKYPDNTRKAPCKAVLQRWGDVLIGTWLAPVVVWR